jgi:hypothetical protein
MCNHTTVFVIKYQLCAVYVNQCATEFVLMEGVMSDTLVLLDWENESSHQSSSYVLVYLAFDIRNPLQVHRNCKAGLCT